MKTHKSEGQLPPQTLLIIDYADGNFEFYWCEYINENIDVKVIRCPMAYSREAAAIARDFIGQLPQHRHQQLLYAGKLQASATKPEHKVHCQKCAERMWLVDSVRHCPRCLTNSNAASECPIPSSRYRRPRLPSRRRINSLPGQMMLF